MRKLILLAVIFLSACDAKLTDEQRKKMRERMEQEELQRVTDGELMAASFERGRLIARLVEARDPDLRNAAFRDSLQGVLHVKLSFLVPAVSAPSALENQLLEAYLSGAGNGMLDDNVQKIGTDSMLYTKPVLQKAHDRMEFVKALSIYMNKKEIVLSLKK